MYDSSGSMIPEPPTVPPTSNTRVNDAVEHMERALDQQNPETVQIDITRTDDKLL